jgi:leucyl-tRNA synthetase
MDGDFHFNSAIAQIMELANAVDALAVSDASTPSAKAVYRTAVETLVMLLYPFTPHVGEELWQILGHPPTLLRQPWPAVDPAALARREVELAIQINGKLRGRITVATGLDPKHIEAAALAADGVSKFLDGKTVRKIIVVPGKLVNIAAS